MNSTHHAQVFRSLSETDLSTLKEKFKRDTELLIIESNALNMDEVRQLINSAHRRPVGFDTKTIMVITNKFSVEAVGHALLKILEEPPVSTRFVFCIPETLQLLPTMASRVEEVRSGKDTQQSNIWPDFLGMTYALRLDYIAKGFLKKDPNWEKELFLAFTNWVNSNSFKQAGLKQEAKLQISDYLGYLTEPGASKKMLYEAISLLIPEKLSNS